MLVEVNPSEVILVAELVLSLLSSVHASGKTVQDKLTICGRLSVKPSPHEAHLNLDMAPILANSQDLFSM